MHSYWLGINLLHVVFCVIFFTCEKNDDDRYIFFFHNRFLEEHGLEELHPEFGRTEYKEILAAFEEVR